jgi:hypothetical protein
VGWFFACASSGPSRDQGATLDGLAKTLATGEHEDVAGQVEVAIRSTITEGASLPTPTGRAKFVVSKITSGGVVLELGEQRTATPITWSCLEGAADFLRGRSWIPIGSNRDLAGNPGTFDEYMKRHAANYVAALLERAGVVELSEERPAKVRLSPRL